MLAIGQLLLVGSRNRVSEYLVFILSQDWRSRSLRACGLKLPCTMISILLLGHAPCGVTGGDILFCHKVGKTGMSPPVCVCMHTVGRLCRRLVPCGAHDKGVRVF